MVGSWKALEDFNLVHNPIAETRASVDEALYNRDIELVGTDLSRNDIEKARDEAKARLDAVLGRRLDMMTETPRRFTDTTAREEMEAWYLANDPEIAALKRQYDEASAAHNAMVEDATVQGRTFEEDF